MARRAMYCAYAVNRITGSPSAITINAPGKTQSRDRGSGDDRDHDERDNVCGQRLAEHPWFREQHRRRVGARALTRRHRLEHAEQLIGALRPRLRILGQALRDEVRQLRWRVDAQIGDRRRRLREMRREHLLRRPATERRRARKDLVRHAAERVDVGPMVDVGIARGLLRRHVRRRADRDAGHRERGATGSCLRCGERLRNAEVGHHRGAAAQQDVVRLDVPMHDAALVGVRKRARHVAEDRQHLGHGQWAARKPSAQTLAVDERHRVVRHAAGIAGVQHGNDVRLLQRRRELDLALEALGADALEEIGGEHLDDHLATEADFVGDEDTTHTAATELALEGISRAERCLQLVAKIRHGGGRGGCVEGRPNVLNGPGPSQSTRA
jgi:hypothetical protein